MAKSRLRPNRKQHKQGKAKDLGWSEGKTLALVIMMALLIAFIVAVFVALFLMR